MAGIGAVGLRPSLVAAPGARLGRLGQVGDRARANQLLAHEQPTGRRLERDLDPLAGETLDPGSNSRATGVDPTPAKLARLHVESVESDLSSMHIEPGYDRHRGPPLRSGLEQPRERSRVEPKE